MKNATETDLVRACRQFLALYGVFAIRVNSGAFVGNYQGRRRFARFNSEPGCSDILGCLPDGKFLAVECKMPGKRLSAAQQSFLDAVCRQGGLGVVVHSIAELDSVLKLEGYL